MRFRAISRPGKTSYDVLQVSQIEPGNFIAGTKILTSKKIEDDAKAMWDNMSDEVTEAYGKDYFKERVEIMKGYMTTGEADQSPVTDAIMNGLLDVFPQKRYQAMNMYTLALYACAWPTPTLPSSVHTSCSLTSLAWWRATA